MKKEYAFIAVDVQNEFATKGGKYYTPKLSVSFLKNKFFPFLKKKNIKVYEIISDYRPPRPGRREDCCHPGTWGYQSIVPEKLKKETAWIKCMNSPLWTRKNIGNKEKTPSKPYQSPKKFDTWLYKNIGNPQNFIPIVFGFTADCCVLATVQELSWRGYEVWVLKEGVDTASGKIKDKNAILKSPMSNWASIVSWKKVKNHLLKK
ncbi:MAG: Isochorismatase family protein [Elusimicrobia bacterium ADurb.Bin231]|nr:MAG: Isochorismatase family protein [Elusimicrobia bacterium ADurb.Bin231]